MSASNGQALPDLKLIESLEPPVWSGAYDRYRENVPPGRWFYPPLSRPPERQQGRSALIRTEAEHQRVRAEARYLAETNPYAIATLRNLRAFILRRGSSVDVKAFQEKDVSEGLVAQAKEVLDQFQDQNRWKEREREAVTRAVRDGEVFMRLFPSGEEGGVTRLRFVEPEQVSAPAAELDATWSFGVKTAAGDVEDVQGYFVKYQTADGKGEDGEEVGPNHLLHLKRNVDRAVKRGVSDLYAVNGQAERAWKVERNAGVGEAVRQGVPFYRKHDAGYPGVNALQQETADAVRDAPGYAGPPREVYYQYIEPGTVVDVPKGMDLTGPPASPSGANAAELVQLSLRAVAVRWAAPEWLASADASNNNFASALVAESPFTLSIEEEQDTFAEYFRSVLWAVLAIAVDEGRLPAEALEQLDVEVTMPSPVVRDPKAVVEMNLLMNQAGLKSKRTAAEEMGLDYDAEYEQLLKEREQVLAQGDPTPEAFAARPPRKVLPESPPGQSADGRASAAAQYAKMAARPEGT